MDQEQIALKSEVQSRRKYINSILPDQSSHFLEKILPLPGVTEEPQLQG